MFTHKCNQEVKYLFTQRMKHKVIKAEKGGKIPSVKFKQKLNVVKRVILPEVIYVFNEILTKSPLVLFTERDKAIIKQFLNKKNKSGSIILPDFK